jgi:hypothetical protein
MGRRLRNGENIFAPPPRPSLPTIGHRWLQPSRRHPTLPRSGRSGSPLGGFVARWRPGQRWGRFSHCRCSASGCGAAWSAASGLRGRGDTGTRRHGDGVTRGRGDAGIEGEARLLAAGRRQLSCFCVEQPISWNLGFQPGCAAGLDVQRCAHNACVSPLADVS